MGEEPPLPHYAEAQPSSFPPQLSSAIFHPNGASHVHAEEEPYTIRCICAFADDDGNTVLCEQCETWQHIECYYHPTLKVPEVHKCVLCLPRTLDSVNATQRQKLLREVVNGTDDKKARKTNSRSHKRSKTKEPPSFSVHQINGASSTDHLPYDRASDSPRDQPPPSKRPKTTHRYSGSMSNNNAPNHNASRHNRTSSNALRLSSPVKPALADCPPDYFSPEFIQVHRTNADYTPAQTNLFLNIGVSDLLSTWLDDPESFAQATHGKSHADVFKQHPTPIDELETPVQKYVKEDKSAVFHGDHPVWPYLVANRDLFEGHFVGELIGSIGHLKDYKADPANNWDRLRHPDHFVFFHPHLPIYIDCRTEGTILRYARRSCRPNIKMETIITGAREYHFCFIATCDIPEGTELTVAWDLESDPQLRDALYRLSGSSSSLDDSQRKYLIRWVETVLAHFGDCACPSFDGMCLMERFDHRVAAEQIHLKTTVPRRKQASKRSPSRIAGSANSRAGSETRPRAQDEDAVDDASSPRSSRSRTSREPTPSRYEIANANGSELSERDKKKLLQQEKLFRKIEQEELDQRKKKRRSGSTLNTPSAPNFKQPSQSYFSTSNPDTPSAGVEARPFDSEFPHLDLPGLRSPSDQASTEQSPPSRPFSRTPVPHAAFITTRPVFAEAAAQTDATNGSTSPDAAERKAYLPLSQRLLRRNHLNRLRVEATAKSISELHLQFGTKATEPVNTEPQTHDPTEVSSDVTDSNGAMSIHMDVDTPIVSGDDEARDAKAHHPDSGIHQTNRVEEAHPNVSEGKRHAAPPWFSGQAQVKMPDSDWRHEHRQPNFHVDLPPRPFRSVVDTNQAAIGTSLASDGTLASPQSASSTGPSATPNSMLAPLVTPNHTSITHPSPAKKKMSLSDYSQRLKAKTPNAEKPQNISLLGSASPPSIGRSPSAVNYSGEPLSNSPAIEGEVGSVKQEPVTPQPQ